MTNDRLEKINLQDSQGTIYASLDSMEPQDIDKLNFSHSAEVQLWLYYYESSTGNNCKILVDGYIPAGVSNKYNIYLHKNCFISQSINPGHP